MAGINQMPKERYADDQKWQIAIHYLDVLFPKFKEFDYFQIDLNFLKNNLSSEDFSKASHVCENIKTLMTHRFNYADVHKQMSYSIVLNDKGREARKFGNHTLYEESLREDKRKDAEIKDLTIEIAKLQKKHYKYYAIWFIIGAIISAVLSNLPEVKKLLQ